jgi:hypothetical protein
MNPSESTKAIRILSAFLETRNIAMSEDANLLLLASLNKFSFSQIEQAIANLMREKIYSGDVAARLVDECEKLKSKSFERLLAIEDSNAREETFKCHLCEDCKTGNVLIVHPYSIQAALDVARDIRPMPSMDAAPHVGSCAVPCTCDYGQKKKLAFVKNRFGDEHTEMKMNLIEDFGEANYHIRWLELQSQANDRGTPMFERLVVRVFDIQRGLAGGQSNRSSDLDNYTQNI